MIEQTYENTPFILIKFLKYLDIIKGYSVNTIKSYRNDILDFFRFIKGYCNIESSIKDFNVFILSNISEKDILAFLVHSNISKDNSARTRERKVIAIKRFYKWLFSIYPIGDSKENPAKYIDHIIQNEQLPKYLNLEQAKKITDIFTIENSKMPIRDNTIISLFLNCGLRVSEVSNLKIGKINFKYKYIRVMGKGKKERLVFMNKAIFERLSTYLEIRTKDSKSVSLKEPVFINYQHKKLGVDGIENICKKAFKLAGLENYGFTTHTLRHTAAMLLYRYSNADLLTLKDFLGHSTILSTEIYLHLYDERIKKAFDNNPLNNINVRVA
jgi:site-specific recombinase XerD